MLLDILDVISSDSPCGTDFKYEDAFLEVEAEIDKSNNLFEGMETDWNKVSSSSEKLLAEHSKDVKILCWWTYSLWKQNAWIGLEKALPVFSTLLSTYEDKLFPKSKKVKISSITWLEEQLDEDILDDNGNIAANIDHKKFLDFFIELEKNFALSLQEERSLFKKIQKALSRVVETQNSENKVLDEKKEVAKPSSSEISEIGSDSDAAKVLSSLKKSAALLQKYWREKEHAHLGAMRLVRMLAWLETEGLPMSEDGKTPLNGPSQESIDEIESLYTEEKYIEALDKVETLISMSPFWLDGHFFTFNILTALENKTAALEAQNALIAYVNADRKILDLSFRDTTPFASLKVKEWLSQNTGALESSSTSNKEANEREETIEACYRLAKKKNIKEAMKILQNNYASSPNKEDQFHWRLAHAEIAKEFGKNELALALVEDLKKDIDKYNLDEWNPKLSSKVFALYLNFNRTQVDPVELQAAYSRLCKIDVEEALEIKI